MQKEPSSVQPNDHKASHVTILGINMYCIGKMPVHSNKPHTLEKPAFKQMCVKTSQFNELISSIQPFIHKEISLDRWRMEGQTDNSKTPTPWIHLSTLLGLPKHVKNLSFKDKHFFYNFKRVFLLLNFLPLFRHVDRFKTLWKTKQLNFQNFTELRLHKSISCDKLQTIITTGQIMFNFSFCIKAIFVRFDACQKPLHSHSVNFQAIRTWYKKPQH